MCHTLPELSALSLISVRGIQAEVLLACKQIKLLDIIDSTFAAMSIENTAVVSAVSPFQLWLDQTFWDTIYPDGFWIWQFLSASQHLQIADEDDASLEWDIGFHNYSQLLRLIFLIVPTCDFEEIFHLSLLPRLEYLSLSLPQECLPSPGWPKPYLIAVSDIFSGIDPSHPI
ncbi:hypothetical protein DL96DRAFT_1677475 [Flagelloscypha sp. PMI_526]|nr:hypothetical protein DL96DRAFT_1677475 [Flagelloscypha sp. PMI_526]